MSFGKEIALTMFLAACILGVVTIAMHSKNSLLAEENKSLSKMVRLLEASNDLLKEDLMACKKSLYVRPEGANSGN